MHVHCMSTGEREKELGLPVGYDRATLDKPKSQVGVVVVCMARAWHARGMCVACAPSDVYGVCTQVGFFTFFVKPMYEALAQLTPLPSQLAAISELCDYWKAQM